MYRVRQTRKQICTSQKIKETVTMLKKKNKKKRKYETVFYVLVNSHINRSFKSHLAHIAILYE